jgi:hypothetical protein
MKKLVTFIIAVAFLSSCQDKDKEMLHFPYSQWTTGFSGHNLYWSFYDSLSMNSSFIEAPADNWEEWYMNLIRYREVFMEKIKVEEPKIKGMVSEDHPGKIHFDPFGYDLQLMPGEKIEIQGKLRSPEARIKIRPGFEFKTRSEELSYVIRNTIAANDSITFFPSLSPQAFSITTEVPGYNVDSFSVTPVAFFMPAESGKEIPIVIDEIFTGAISNPERQSLHRKISRHLDEERSHPPFKAEEDLHWMHNNYVMGFAFMWDNDIWDFQLGEFRVDHYCNKMLEEFGGLNSVIFWHSYPNLGIDEKNQFDFIKNIPGGLDGFKQVVAEFHKNGVKVFFTYNPWDLDTNPPDDGDAREIAEIINYCNVDGVFLDTWRSSVGGISIYSQEKFIREEIEKTGKKLALLTEILPDFKDLTGFNALTGSWGQEVLPFNYTDLSHIKWLMPWHKQYFIKRMKKNRKRELAHAWVNGQGIMIWENIFGTMNPWHAEDRQALRKMNTIWKRFGHVYLSPDWKPFIPAKNPYAKISAFEARGIKLFNIVNTSDTRLWNLKLEVDTLEGNHFYDLWNGAEVYPSMSYGKHYISLDVNRFSCLLQTDSAIHNFHNILSDQQMESINELPGIFNDRHIRELSLKVPLAHNYKNNQDSLIAEFMLVIPGGTYSFESRHIWREGHCYPDMDAVDNHDLTTSRENGYLEILHYHTEAMDSFHIMPGVVTNAEFELFLDLTDYRPTYERNFLKHWNGSTCPDEIKNEPVVYVSLEDARAFADWAGMKLPTEWQWQKAAEYHPRDFRFNKVFEWTESERFDGHNRFVNLRGGSSDWELTSSWWYFPGAPYGLNAGGPQPFDSHVKYFLMYPGLDRASTIGFRCVWEAGYGNQQFVSGSDNALLNPDY